MGMSIVNVFLLFLIWVFCFTLNIAILIFIKSYKCHCSDNVEREKVLLMYLFQNSIYTLYGGKYIACNVNKNYRF